uniref:Uncharacterized protein n=1 Tax=Romanomermis culicivorax TaxID=13658 RepID=A0A915JPM6_ROMCU
MMKYLLNTCGFSTSTDTGLTIATAKICDAGYIMPINDAENDWGCQGDHVVLTEGDSDCYSCCGSGTGAYGSFHCLRTAPGNSNRLHTGGHQSNGIDESDSLSVTDGMQAIWSMDLAKKYLHLPWVLLNEPFKAEALTATNVVLSTPAPLWILGPKVPRRALEFISNDTIQATPIDKILLDREPSWLAVDTIRGAVKQASRITQPVPAVAALPPMTMTGAQTLSAIAQQ